MNTQERISTFLDFMKLPDGTPIVSVELYDYLIKIGFFEKPASVKWHGNYTGGLFDHSLAVAKSLVMMTDDLGIPWKDPRSPYIVGMLHDLCKADDYVQNHADSWTYNDEKILTGHGDKSVMMLSQFINLTEEELYCIKFHMGAYDKDHWDEYDRAIRKYEAVLWTHTADMYASKVMNI